MQESCHVHLYARTVPSEKCFGHPTDRQNGHFRHLYLHSLHYIQHLHSVHQLQNCHSFWTSWRYCNYKTSKTSKKVNRKNYSDYSPRGKEISLFVSKMYWRFYSDYSFSRKELRGTIKCITSHTFSVSPFRKN